MDIDWQAALTSRAIDRHLAQQLARIDGTDSDELMLAAVLASRDTADGHVCVRLASYAGRPLAGEHNGQDHLAPPLDAWRRALLATTVVGEPGERTPLVLDEENRLYLYRYWHYEYRLASNLYRRVRLRTAGMDLAGLRSALDRLFPASPDGTVDWQKVAAAAAVLQRFCVISGGPGTGKTTTVARLLALLIEMHELGGPEPGRRPEGDRATEPATGQPLRIALVAPTGKAAARLQESLRAALSRIAIQEAIRRQIPEQASTIHRLLGVRRHSHQFRYSAGHQLPLDVVVVDEASMVDLALMTKLVEAIPPSAHLILLGDKDQLASVEAGAVLGELCAGGEAFSEGMARQLGQVTGQPVESGGDAINPMSDAVVVLQHSYRFAGDSGIGHLASAVNRGDSRAALGVLQQSQWDDVELTEPGSVTELETHILERVAVEYGEFLQAVRDNAPVAEVFALFERYRVLCAHRRGPFSAEHMNEVIGHWVRRRNRISVQDEWYPGRPVMVQRNDYSMRLYNGDIGIALPDAGRGQRLSVFFQDDATGAPRALAPVRLPTHQTVYAMTVHKSQGSEFDRVSLVLPDRLSGVLSRELVYTGLTRARRRVEIVASEGILSRAIASRVSRFSGLQSQLRGLCEP